MVRFMADPHVAPRNSAGIGRAQTVAACPDRATGSAGARGMQGTAT